MEDRPAARKEAEVKRPAGLAAQPRPKMPLSTGAPPPMAEASAKPKAENAKRPQQPLFSDDGGPPAQSEAATGKAFVAQRDMGLNAYREKDFETAATCLARAHNLRPSAIVVSRALASALLLTGRPQRAHDIAAAALQRMRDRDLEKTRLEAARRLTLEALETPSRGDFLSLLGDHGPALAASAQGALFRALSAACSYDVDAAQEALLELREEDPSAPPPRLARNLFPIDADAAICLAEAGLRIAPADTKLRVERLWFALEIGEIEDPTAFMREALSDLGYGLSLPDLRRLYEFTLSFDAHEPTSDTLRALRRRQMQVIADPLATAEDLHAAGALAVRFGDFTIAQNTAAAMERLGHSAAQLTQDIATGFELAGDLAPHITEAADYFWRDLLTRPDPLAAFFEGMPPDRVVLATPPGMADPNLQDDALHACRHSIFTAARVFGGHGLPHEIQLFPWDARHLAATPAGKPLFAHGALRGDGEPGDVIFHKSGPIAHYVHFDRLGYGGWSETARALPFAAARSSETAAHYRSLIAACPPLRAPEAGRAADAVLVALQRRDDLDLLLERVPMLRMLRASVAWARRAGRRVLIRRPPDCRNAEITELLRKMQNNPLVEVSTAPVRDMIARASCVVTVNDAAGFEAILRKKRVILCGAADYRHAAVSVSAVRELHAALDASAAPPDGPAIERFLYDYFTGPMANLLAPGDVEAKLTLKLREAGWIS